MNKEKLDVFLSDPNTADEGTSFADNVMKVLGSAVISGISFYGWSRVLQARSPFNFEDVNAVSATATAVGIIGGLLIGKEVVSAINSKEDHGE